MSAKPYLGWKELDYKRYLNTYHSEEMSRLLDVADENVGFTHTNNVPWKLAKSGVESNIILNKRK